MKNTKNAVKCLVCGVAENCYDVIEGTLVKTEESADVDIKELKMKDVEFKAFDGQDKKRPEFIPVDMDMPDDSTLMGFVCSEKCEDSFNRNPMQYAHHMIEMFPVDDGDFVMLGRL